MIKINDIEYRTESQWNQKHRAILKRQRDKGICKEWYIDRTHTTSAIFYCESQTRPYNQRELSASKRKQRELVKTRKERLSCKCCGKYYGRLAKYELEYGLCEFCQKDHTAWQWLYYVQMAPTKDAVAHRKYPEYWNPEINDWDYGDRPYFYYKHNDVKPVSDKRFEVLKKQYIKLYGGWEEIDLEHTEYNGKKWWK